ncbi:MAG: hypothetical protein MUD01_10830 [Chloroflexaceae bacterium]|jgi:hypothetical protein|nr:hypothetical protein [Chloroflexaceae bacterium]
MTNEETRSAAPLARGSKSATPVRYARLAPLYKGLIWTSFVINAILLVVVGVLVGILLTQFRQITDLSTTARSFAGDNVAELQDVVNKLQDATIKTTIPLNEPLPLKGSGVVVPVDQVTQVTLTQPVPLLLAGADIDLGSGNRLRAQNIRLTLPEGTPLEIALKMDIPLDNVTIPVKLNVPVSIPLKDTELGPQFERLGALVERLVTPAEFILIRPTAASNGQNPPIPQAPTVGQP